MILDICGGQAGPIDDQIVNCPKREPVRMRVARAARVLGIPLSHEVVSDVFKRLGLTFSVDGDVFVVEPPSYRFDIEIEEDLIEEVARIYGFEQIPAKPPVAENAMRPTNEARRTMHDVRHAVAARDYHEVVNFAFVETEWEADFAGNTQPIPLLNPIASQYSVMRSTLIGGLLDKVRYNLNRKASRVRLFEVGRVFRRDAEVADGGLSVAGYAQPMRVGGIAYGPAAEEQWGVPARAVDFFDVKGDVESLLWPLQARFERAEHSALHPGRAARVVLDGRAVGWIGELHPRWLQKYELPTAPVVWELDLDAITAVGLPAYREVPRVPAVTRDIALVVRQDVGVQDLVDAFEKAAAGMPWQRYLQGVVLFDEFRPKAATAAIGAQEKSLAFRITLQDTDSTLQDDLVEAATQQLIRAAGDAFGARLRA